MFAVWSHLTHCEVTMRRAKRDMSKRAYNLGYVQGLKGHAKERCPFKDDTLKRGQWMAGWRVGHASYVAGYITPLEAFG